MSREVPDGWSDLTLGDLGQITGGTTPSRDNPSFWEGGSLFWATPSDITALPPGQLTIEKTKSSITEIALKKTSIKMLPVGSVLMTSRATIGFPAINTEPMATNQGFANFLPSSRYDASFLAQWIIFNRATLENAAGGSTFAEISKTTLKTIPISLPPLHEQRRIAEILSSVDEAISATRAVIEHTRKVKQGALEHLLTKGIGHTRFKQTEIGEIPEGWEVVQVSDVAASIDSGWSPDCEKVAASEGEWGILKTSAVVWDGYQPHENKKLPHSLAPRPEIEVKAGDVLITRAGPVDRTGVVALVKNTQRKLMLSDKIIRIQTNADQCMPGFLSLWLSSPSAQNEIIKKKSGMAQSQTNISQKALRELFVSLPPLYEQNKIAEAVQSVDDGISAESAKLDALVVAKSALMSDLLIGRKRVTDALPMAAE